MRLLTMQLNSITVMDVFAFGGAAVGIIAAMVQFANGQVPFYAAFCVVFLSAEFFLPMRALGSFFHTAMNGMAVAEKMFDILDAPEPKQGSRSVDPAHAGIVVRDVSYSYDGSARCSTMSTSPPLPEASPASSAKAVRANPRWPAFCAGAIGVSRAMWKSAVCRSARFP